ncbi:hypothetical protein OQA88_4527 [Cercophora sp. LCS_1]
MSDLPSPPFITAPGLANLRDTGGYPIGEPATTMVRRGLVYRSAKPLHAGLDGIERLRELGISHVYDLRSIPELINEGALESAAILPAGLDNAQRVFVPVFLDQDYSPAAIASRFTDYGSGAEGFVRAYDTLLEAAASPNNSHQPFKTILTHLASSTAPPTPILIHCTAGKDRTGLVCAIILALCGVEDDVIAHEYALTELGLGERKEQIVDRLAREVFKGDRAKADLMVSARKEYMSGTLDMIREKYGTVEKYAIDHCRVLPQEVEQIRRNLVVEIDTAGGRVPVDWRSHAELVQ